MQIFRMQQLHKCEGSWRNLCTNWKMMTVILSKRFIVNLYIMFIAHVIVIKVSEHLNFDFFVSNTQGFF